MEIKKDVDNQHCGTTPKRIAFGIAPLGIISIGIVPMGVVSIGVVPMGVFSFGAVAMGIVNLSIVGMGIISSGVTTMGVWEYSPRLEKHNHKHNQSINSLNKESTDFSKDKKFLFDNKIDAEKMSQRLNCKGVHKMGDMWMPCNSHN